MLLKQFSMKNLDSLIINSNTQKELYNQLTKDSLVLDCDFESNQKLKVTETLITCDLFVRWLNNINKRNECDGTYLFYNHIEENNDIFFNNENNLYEIKLGKEDHPVRGITWLGALLFSASFGGRLVTEKEWEYLASSGERYVKYVWGDDSPTKQKANYGNYYGDTTPVRKFPPNKFGLYDMAGNLREWCIDSYHPCREVDKIDTKYRVVKGGAWDKTTQHLIISNRGGKWYRMGTMGIGFRVVWEV